MQPQREASHNGVSVREYYWAGDYVVYVNNRLSDKTFAQAVAEAKRAACPTPPPERIY